MTIAQFISRFENHFVDEARNVWNSDVGQIINLSRMGHKVVGFLSCVPLFVDRVLFNLDEKEIEWLADSGLFDKKGEHQYILRSCTMTSIDNEEFTLLKIDMLKNRVHFLNDDCTGWERKSYPIQYARWEAKMLDTVK